MPFSAAPLLGEWRAGTSPTVGKGDKSAKFEWLSLTELPAGSMAAGPVKNISPNFLSAMQEGRVRGSFDIV